MRKLRANSELNGPEEYYQQFLDRRQQEVNWMDRKRWLALIRYFKGGKLLDIGCLDSLVPLMAKKKYPQAEIWGLDQSKKMIEKLAEDYPEINYTTGDAYATDFPNEYFDYVVAGELIEHLEYPEIFIAEAFRILKSKGILALTTPKEETALGEVDGHRHLWSITASDIRSMCRPYMKGALIKEIPSWLERRFKYHHPYLLCLITKK